MLDVDQFFTCLNTARYEFLPRDAMQARPIPSCGVCLFVLCLSVSYVRTFCQNE